VRERSEAPSPSLSSMVRQMVLQPVVRTDIYKPTIERPTALGVADPAPLAPALPPESIPETPRPAAPLRPLPDASRRNALPVPILKPIATDVPVFPVVPPTPTPTIHVTIGRIEVRATTNAAPAAQKPRAEPAMMSLDDYLTQRAGGAGQ
jgi:hypothetical protein